MESGLFALRRSINIGRRRGSFGMDKQGSEDSLMELEGSLGLGMEEISQSNQFDGVILG